MPYSFWETIAETPWWVYLFFLWLLNIAYLNTKPRNVSLKSFVLSSILFISITLIAIPTLINFNKQTFIILINIILFSSVLGWLQFKLRKITVDTQQSVFNIPGSWELFLIFPLLIFAKYYFSFSINLHTIKEQQLLLTIMSGLAIGLFVGRTGYLIRQMKKI